MMHRGSRCRGRPRQRLPPCIVREVGDVVMDVVASRHYTLQPRAGPATDIIGGDGMVRRGSVGVTFRDSAVEGNVFLGK